MHIERLTLHLWVEGGKGEECKTDEKNYWMENMRERK